MNVILWQKSLPYPVRSSFIHSVVQASAQKPQESVSPLQDVYRIFYSQFRKSDWYSQIDGGEKSPCRCHNGSYHLRLLQNLFECTDPAKDISIGDVFGMDDAQAK